MGKGARATTATTTTPTHTTTVLRDGGKCFRFPRGRPPVGRAPDSSLGLLSAQALIVVSILRLFGGALDISTSPSGMRDSPPMLCCADLAAVACWCRRSFSVSRTTIRYSLWSTIPLVWMKDSRVSAARLASSCVGDVGEEPMGVDAMVFPDIGGRFRRAAMLELLLLCRRRGEAMALSMLKGGADISFMGDSSADDGAVDETWYLGVSASGACGGFMYSRSSVGSVWLRGLWKLELPGGMCRLWSVGRNPPTLGSGEKVKGAVGLSALPEKDEAAKTVNALERDVVLWLLVCLYAPLSEVKSM